MKIALVQPNLDDKHPTQRQAYESRNRPPETGLAVLSSWVNAYSARQHDITVLNPERSIEELSEQAAGYDILGISDWFSNHDNCTALARNTKTRNRAIKNIFGGVNASMICREMLRNHPYVDYVVSRDGENALLAIADGKPPEEVPNLWRRTPNGIEFTHHDYTELKRMPLWDFSNFQDAEQRMREYTETQKSGLDPWLVPPLTIFSLRGCMKSAKEGLCSYCVSAEEKVRALPPEKLWEQVSHLNQLYGAEIFYMSDDIFTISPRRIRQIADAKPDGVKARIRAYGYLPYMARLNSSELEAMASDLQRIGVFNLFFGSENYDPQISVGMNKEYVSMEETDRIIRTIYHAGGIRTTIAYILGLPGESKESLEMNLRSLKTLLDADDCIERLYISVGMPLKGTAWCRELESNQVVVSQYRKLGKELAADDSPEYDLLCRLSIEHMTSVSTRDVDDYLNRMTEAAKHKMPDYRIGGFLLDVGE